MQSQLNELGVRHFQELASLNKADIKVLSDRLGIAGRIEQENWLGQAQILATGGETYYARRLSRGEATVAPAPQATPAPAASASIAAEPAQSSTMSDMGYLRSVRSEALVDPETVRPLRPGSGIDDLKRIRGIGVLIEKKLNSLGITTTSRSPTGPAPDIERISNILDFKGRIERENWIEQARILATGGADGVLPP